MFFNDRTGLSVAARYVWISTVATVVPSTIASAAK